MKTQRWILVIHLFLCSVAPTAPAAQPAVSLATVYGCKSCAAGLVFMCVSRASLACCDCYTQGLFGKLGAATAVSGFRAKELDPYHRRCRTVHQGIEATTPDEPRAANAKKYRRARSSASTTLVGGPLKNQRRAPRGRSGGGTLSSASCASAGRRLDNRASFTRTRDGNRAKCSAIGNSWM